MREEDQHPELLEAYLTGRFGKKGTKTMGLTPMDVQAFWNHMRHEFGSAWEAKNESKLMQVAGSLLEALDIQSKETFLKNFVTTIGKTIYIPFTVGVEQGDEGRIWPLWNQVRVCVHEHVHVVQGDREGWATFDARYLSSSSYRAGYEAEAYGSEVEMEFWRTGQIMDYVSRLQTLKTGYGCSDDDVAQAVAMVEIRAGVVAQGVVESRPAQVAIEWLEKNVKGLRIAG
jgi:hypothetical protein